MTRGGWSYYDVPITWTGRSVVRVRAQTPDSAMDKAERAARGEEVTGVQDFEIPELDIDVGSPR